MSATEAQTKPHFALLDDHQYLNLTTYRKNGTDVTRPVWFAADGDTLYLISVEDSGKVKHIRNNPDVIVGPCDARGNPLSDETALGRATVYAKGDPTADKANRVLNGKYGLIKRLFGLNFLLRQATVVWIEIVPRQS
jgi:PPOX class probable F420-dependent enzyme